MAELISLQFPLQQELFTTVRLTVGGVCALAGLDIDSGEDCKVGVTESLLLLMRRGCKSACVKCYRAQPLQIRIFGEGDVQEGEPSPEDEISVALLSALVEGFSMKKSQKGYEITFDFGA